MSTEYERAIQSFQRRRAEDRASYCPSLEMRKWRMLAIAAAVLLFLETAAIFVLLGARF